VTRSWSVHGLLQTHNGLFKACYYVSTFQKLRARSTMSGKYKNWVVALWFILFGRPPVMEDPFIIGFQLYLYWYYERSWGDFTGPLVVCVWFTVMVLLRRLAVLESRQLVPKHFCRALHSTQGTHPVFSRSTERDITSPAFLTSILLVGLKLITDHRQNYPGVCE